MKISKLLVLFITALISGNVSAGPLDHGYYVYDDFSNRTIDAERWLGNQSFTHLGEGEYTQWNSLGLERKMTRDAEPGEKKGKAVDGALHLVNTLQGTLSTDQGLTRSRIGYGLKQSDIGVGVGGRLRFEDYQVSGLEADCNIRSRSRLRIIAGLFNAEFVSPEPGDSTGEVMAYVGLRAQPDFTDGQMRVEAVVFKCLDPDCVTSESLGIFRVFDFIEAGEDAVLTMEMLPVSLTEQYFIARYVDELGTEQEAMFSNPWPIVGPAHHGMAVQAANDLPACQTEPAFGYIDAFVDEVYLKTTPSYP